MDPDIYNGGRYLRRLALVGGYARCPQTALYLGEAGEGEIAATMAINRVVRALVAEAEAYEEAVRLIAGSQPDQWISVPDDDGVETLVESAAWTAWVAAGATVAAAGPGLLHLTRTRADALDEGEEAYELALPGLPAFDPRAETADLVDGAWVVRALTEAERGAHPLRPAAFMTKMAFGKLIIATLGSSLGGSVLSIFGGVLALADNIDWADVFDCIDGDPARPGYAAQLLADEVVTPAHVTALRDGWLRSCAA